MSDSFEEYTSFYDGMLAEHARKTAKQVHPASAWNLGTRSGSGLLPDAPPASAVEPVATVGERPSHGTLPTVAQIAHADDVLFRITPCPGGVSLMIDASRWTVATDMFLSHYRNGHSIFQSTFTDELLKGLRDTIDAYFED